MEIKLQPGDYAKGDLGFINMVCDIASKYNVRAGSRTSKTIPNKPGYDAHSVWMCSGDYRGKINQFCGSVSPAQRELTQGQFLLGLEQLCGIKVEEKIKIGEWNVEFKADGIQVGCTFVSKEQVKQVLDRLNSK